MARTTETRVKVRELADKIASEGGAPTPTLIRELLGGGSPNTIVDELKLWTAARSPTQPSGQLPAGVVRVAEKLGLDELAGLLRAGQSTQETVLALVQELHRGLTQNAQLTEALSALSATCEGLAHQMANDRAWMADELSKMNERFEGVQKMMLLSIDEARSEARTWKAAHHELTQDFEAWRTAATRARNRLELDNAELRGRLEALSPPAAPAAPDTSASEQPDDELGVECHQGGSPQALGVVGL